MGSTGSSGLGASPFAHDINRSRAGTRVRD